MSRYTKATVNVQNTLGKIQSKIYKSCSDFSLC